mgnify:CR=1 FL=1
MMHIQKQFYCQLIILRFTKKDTQFAKAKHTIIELKKKESHIDTHTVTKPGNNTNRYCKYK